MATISVNYSNIPCYLHEGAFYKNLDQSDAEKIEIPTPCYKEDGDSVADLQEFATLLNAMIYWVLDDIPSGIRRFCLRHDKSVWHSTAVNILPGGTQSLILQDLLVGIHDGSFDFMVILRSRLFDLIYHAIELMEEHRKDHSLATRQAAMIGNLSVLVILHERGFPWHDHTCLAASEEGHLECLRYAHEKGCPWDAKVATLAAKKGHLDCLRYAHESGIVLEKDVYIAAAKLGHVNCIEYAHQCGLKWHDDLQFITACEGQAFVMQYAHENGCPWHELTIVAASERGHLDCLVYALANGSAHHIGACGGAAQQGQLACLECLFEHNAPWDAETTAQAARGGHVACLQFLHQNGCPWDKKTVNTAAFHGHVEFLKYALEYRCPYDKELMIAAVEGGHFACIDHLVDEQSFTLNEDVFLSALLRGNLNNLTYLVDVGCPYKLAQFQNQDLIWRQLHSEFNSDEFLECVKFALERGWRMNANFVAFVRDKNIRSCYEFLKIEEPVLAHTDPITGAQRPLWMPVIWWERFLVASSLCKRLFKCASITASLSALTHLLFGVKFSHTMKLVTIIALFGNSLYFAPIGNDFINK